MGRAEKLESLGENGREEQPVVGAWLWQWREAGGMAGIKRENRCVGD